MFLFCFLPFNLNFPRGDEQEMAIKLAGDREMVGDAEVRSLTQNKVFACTKRIRDASSSSRCVSRL